MTSAPAHPSPHQDAPLIAAPWAVPRADGRLFTKDPSVVRFGDHYLLYCSLPPEDDGDRAWRIGIARSSDLRDWELVGTLTAESEGFPTPGVTAPGAVVLDGTVHLFYQSYGNGPADAICHATSVDGVEFTPDPANPVFRPQGAWSCGRAIDADVVVDGDRLLLAYATRDPGMHRQMLGVAAAPLSGGFGRGSWRDLSHEGPALAPELDWERECIEAPAFVRRGAELVMFYAGGYNNEPQQIGWATSRDGASWRRGSSEPFLPNGPEGSWNSSESGHPGCFVDADGRTYLFFQGNDTHGRTNLIAAVELEWVGSEPRVVTPGG